MKHLKTIETINHIDTIKNGPQIGDYVLCNEFTMYKDFDNFQNNNIGKIINISKNDIITYSCKFTKIPKEISGFFKNNGNTDGVRRYLLNEIVHFSKNKKDLEIILQAKKYNL